MAASVSHSCRRLEKYMSVIRIIDEYFRWRSFEYTHAECMTALRNRDGAIAELGTEQDIEAAIRLLEETGPVDRETVTRLLQGGKAALEIIEGNRPME